MLRLYVWVLSASKVVLLLDELGDLDGVLVLGGLATWLLLVFILYLNIRLLTTWFWKSIWIWISRPLAIILSIFFCWLLADLSLANKERRALLLVLEEIETLDPLVLVGYLHLFKGLSQDVGIVRGPPLLAYLDGQLLVLVPGTRNGIWILFYFLHLQAAFLAKHSHVYWWKIAGSVLDPARSTCLHLLLLFPLLLLIQHLDIERRHVSYELLGQVQVALIIIFLLDRLEKVRWGGGWVGAPGGRGRRSRLGAWAAAWVRGRGDVDEAVLGHFKW